MEKELSIEELHRHGLEAFRVFIAFCEEHQLTYYAIGGTLLGAVRHKGFIPWDDDIDVAMPRPDYDKLVQLSGQFPKPFVLEEYRYSEGFQSYFMKIRNENVTLTEAVTEETDERRGYLIDVMPLDGTPDNPILRKFYYAKVLGLRFLCGAANVHTGILTSRPKWEQQVLKICRWLRLYKFLTVEKIYRKMDTLFQQQNVQKAKQIGTIMGAYKVREIVPREYFGLEEEAVFLEFEDVKLRAPAQYDVYLTHMYGDYRKLPPKEEQKIHYNVK